MIIISYSNIFIFLGSAWLISEKEMIGRNFEASLNMMIKMATPAAVRDHSTQVGE
jgi:hypothetical protein